MDKILKDVEFFAKNNTKESNGLKLGMLLQNLKDGNINMCYKIILGNFYYLNRRGIKIDKSKIEKLANGESIRYHDNGNISSSIQYVDGKINGKYETFYPDGKIKTTCNYVEDKKHGLFLRFKRDGKIKNITKYHFGNLIL